MKTGVKDGSDIDVSEDTKLLDLLKKQNPDNRSRIFAARVDGIPVDLTQSVPAGASVEFISFDDPTGREVLLHSCAHLMAQAVKELHPEAQLGIGPALEDQFYYDILLPEFLNPEDLDQVQRRMQKIVKRNLPIERLEISREEAIKLFEKRGENLKVELLDEMEEAVSIYQQGDFIDLCRGPHVPNINWIKNFKLLSLAGAYWRGDESQAMLQRIYGTCYPTPEELQDHLDRYEEAKKRDHRRLGKALELFSFHPEAPGTPFWHPKGQVLYNEVVKYWTEVHQEAGYQLIQTPTLLHDSLWHLSGHYDHYRENMYFTSVEDRDYAIKPMNCPGGLLIYKTYQVSYKDLPLKMGELGLVHRYERSGELHGLIRVRAFSIDDAHIFCLPEQIENEVVDVIHLILGVYRAFGFDEFRVELSTKPEKSIGSAESWEKAEAALGNALAKAEIQYDLNPGDGAFYGPKIDFHIRDCLGRSWQCGTIQLDFSMPERFELEYVGSDGNKHQPVMIHRAVFGSLERFIGLLIEQYAGDFPLWLAPVQARILAITDDQNEYAQKIYDEMSAAALRVEIDVRNEKIGRKIREAEIQKIPIMLIVGKREVEDSTVSLRLKGKGDQGSQSVEEVVSFMREKIKNKQAVATGG
ncbi:threonine--tRNA ligase [candidate division LCP-89 bacterium B3_LCP]|uniref:Threonine--tRNA ligase n=1 Tax=candidate division LCP-89 bacterium B3_LCP TaxID=2012998 RepID=A0A532V5H1_UNCL8|nr:MAG: threonine--tRNA ligase [candidate division LCP-89 bacterium B3_LCP]